jgi:hypothetical protein
MNGMCCVDMTLCLNFLSHLSQRRNHGPLLITDKTLLHQYMSTTPLRITIQQEMLELAGTFDVGDEKGALAGRVKKYLVGRIEEMMEGAAEALSRTTSGGSIA